VPPMVMYGPTLEMWLYGPMGAGVPGGVDVSTVWLMVGGYNQLGVEAVALRRRASARCVACRRAPL
jgi:hypothetical protein